ncbi:MAG: hypothetical protein GXY12_01670 [Clostridiaceae bacterium]|nr:hypothetical protein [Clostridiaceae bacterium]
MKIGYACKTIGVPDTGTKSCLMKNANEESIFASFGMFELEMRRVFVF